MNLTDKERFDQYVRVTPGCWWWTGYREDTGYGRFRLKGRRYQAHTAAVLLYTGNADALMWLHKCDNRACVNPDHLFPGDHQANMEDMVRKGRSPKHERNGRALVTVETVLQIRDLHASGLFSQKTIANFYGVSRPLVSAIITRRNWSDVI